MEHIQGLVIDARLRGRWPSLRDTLTLSRGVLGGLSRAHPGGVVHRNLNPRTLPVGSYPVTSTFAGRSPQQLGTVVIEVSDQSLIACDHRFAICPRQ